MPYDADILSRIFNKRGKHYTMNKPVKNKRKNKDQADGSNGQITAMPDIYEDFCPEAINEIFFTESVQRDRSVHHENLWFFTRC
jgi:hypothetical protein